MTQYMVLAPHLLSTGQIVPANTLVGDGTPYPWSGAPTPDMVGTDAAGIAAVNALQASLGGPVPGFSNFGQQTPGLEENQAAENLEVANEAIIAPSAPGPIAAPPTQQALQEDPNAAA